MSNIFDPMGHSALGTASGKVLVTKRRQSAQNPFSRYLHAATYDEMGFNSAADDATHNEMLAMTAIFESTQPERNDTVHEMEVVKIRCNVHSKQFTAFLGKLPISTPTAAKQGLIDAFFAANDMAPADFFKKHPGFISFPDTKFAVYGFTQITLIMLSAPLPKTTVLMLIHNSKNILLPIKIL